MLFRLAPSEGRLRVGAALAALLLTATLMGCPGDSDSGGVAGSSPLLLNLEPAQVKVVNCGWYGNTIPTPSFVAANWSFLQTQPFDGQVLYLRTPDLSINATVGVMKSVPMSYATMMTILNPIVGKTSSTMTDNFALVQGSTPPDFFDDWSVVVQNWANLARACKDAGLKGICFDNEQYHSPWGNYGTHSKYYGSKSLAQYETQARLRGKQVMEAMVAQFPAIAVLTLHGPYVSEPDAPPALEFPTWQSGNELLGPFCVGKVEGMGTSSKVIDGGELYSLRTDSQFAASVDWRRNVMPSESVNCSFIPAGLRPYWPTRCTMSFGVYDRPFWGKSMDPSILRPTLANAMRNSDHYVWFYPEAYTYLLPPGSGGAPSVWVDAIRLAKEDVGSGGGGGGGGGTGVPAAPSNLVATAVSPFDVDLAWSDNSGNESTFLIERRTVINGTWAQVATAPAGTTYLRDGGLWSGTGYVYRVRAGNSSGNSAYSNESTTMTHLVGGGGVPAAPSNLVAHAVSTSEIDLTWTDNSSNESTFLIERRAMTGGTWTQIASVPAGTTYLRNGGLASGTWYLYRVRAGNSSGNSSYSNEAKAKTRMGKK